MTDGTDTPALNLTALSLEQAARLLGLPMASLQRHLEQGAPTGAGGTINLVHYAAWLNSEGTDGA